MPQPLLSGQQEYVDNSSLLAEIRELKRQLAHAELEVKHAKEGVATTLAEIRRLTMPFYCLLQAVHGEIEAMGVPDAAAATSSAALTSTVWEAWKSRLGKPCGKIIDALLTHRSLNSTQIAIATGINGGNIATYMSKLNKAGLINKNGRDFSLKPL